MLLGNCIDRDGPVNARDFLGTVAFFADVLDSAQLDALAAGSLLTKFARGSVIIPKHDAGSSMFTIVSGSVEVSTRDTGRRSHVATLHAGDIIGEMSLLTGARRSATVIAADPVVALEISKSAMKPILDAAPALYDRFAAMLDKRRLELDRIHGDGFWNLQGLPRDQLGPNMRRFFAS